MASKTFYVPKISCNHCVMNIKRELGALSGVSDISCDAATKKVSVSYKTDADLVKIKETLTEIGYPVEKEVS
jgi:copper chaperone